MPRARVPLAAVIALTVALLPGLADARAGGGGSFGSRGSMTYSAPPSTNTAPYSASPMQRSMTPQSQPYGSPMSQGRSSGLMGGLMGGLVFAGLFGLLFGHGFMGGGLGMFGLLGLLLQVFLIVMVHASTPFRFLAGAAG